VPRRPGILHTLVEHHGDEFLILTDEEAPNFRLMATPVANPDRANWHDVIPHQEDALLEWFDVFEHHLALYGREEGFSQVWVRDMGSGAMAPVPFDEAIYTAYPGINPEFATSKLRIVYSSPVTPWSDIEIDMETGAQTVLKQEEIIGGHDPSAFVTERLFATAPDGTQIPISLVYRRDGPEGPRPMRLDGYGAYGISSNPEFVVNRLTLLNRGVTIAIAHVRGGAELGRHWWEEGRLLTKRNTFSDFIASAEHLIAEGYTAPDRLSILGGSAGGLLMGVAATERPDLFAAVIADVPAVDLVGLLLRSAIGPGNRPEFGDPHDPAALHYIRSYDPYETVRAQAYPMMLVTGGFNDPRVPYWVPAKWVAKLRDIATGDNLLLLRTEMGSGHFGASGFYEAERQTAFLYAFLLLALDMTEVEPVKDVATPQAAKRTDASAVFWGFQSTGPPADRLGTRPRAKEAVEARRRAR
jgi:oligopeptidase B